MNVLYLSSNKMGEGNPELGEKLLFNFLSKVVEQETKIDAVVCVNTSVYLVCESSNVIKSLKVLEERGAVVSSCGTCIDFYNLRDKVKVGNIGSMDVVAKLLTTADKVFRV